VASAIFISKPIDCASQFKHRTFDRTMGGFFRLDRLFWSRHSQGYEHLSKQGWKVGLNRVSAVFGLENVGGDGFEEVLAGARYKGCVTGTAPSPEHVALKRSRQIGTC
jgi:hypothetical protein